MGDVVNFENKSDSYKQLFDDYIGNDDYLMYTCINVLSEMNCPLTKEGISQFQEDTGELDVTGVITVNELFYLIDELNMDNRQAVFDHIDRMEYSDYMKSMLRDTNKNEPSRDHFRKVLIGLCIAILIIYGGISMIADIITLIGK
jgi:hypothetical protein